jgi:hypothetical protein
MIRMLVPKMFVMPIMDVYIMKSIVTIKTYVPETYAAKIMGVTMRPCAAMIKTPVL